jgi:hypothetical protein
MYVVLRHVGSCPGRNARMCMRGKMTCRWANTAVDMQLLLRRVRAAFVVASKTSFIFFLFSISGSSTRCRAHIISIIVATEIPGVAPTNCPTAVYTFLVLGALHMRTPGDRCRFQTLGKYPFSVHCCLRVCCGQISRMVMDDFHGNGTGLEKHTCILQRYILGS